MNKRNNDSNKEKVMNNKIYLNSKNPNNIYYNNKRKFFPKDSSQIIEKMINKTQNNKKNENNGIIQGNEEEKSYSSQNSKNNIKKEYNAKEDNNSPNISYDNNIFNSQNMMNGEVNEEFGEKEFNSISTTDGGDNKTLNNNKELYEKYRLIKNYKNWNGDNYFIFKAHMIEGPCNFRPTLMTGCIITIPTILFFIFNTTFMEKKLTILVLFIILILYLFALIFMLIASFTEPGIIRRFNFNKKNMNNINNIQNFKRKEAKIFQLGYIINYKFCSSCGIIRPNRSTHCSDCNNCVERLDHHCLWIGNCTGKRNYLYFFIFLILLNILYILFIIFCIAHIIMSVNENKKNKSVAESFCEIIISLYIIIYCFIIMWFIIALLIYHLKLIFNNTTTKEELRNAFKNNQGNPYKRNTLTNIKTMLIPKIKKYSILDILRGDVKEISDYNKKGSLFYKKKEDINLKINETKETLKQKEIYIHYQRENSKPINEEYEYDNILNNDKYQNKSIDMNNSYFLSNASFKSSTSLKEDITKNHLSKSFIKQNILKFIQNTEKKQIKNNNYSSQKIN